MTRFAVLALIAFATPAFAQSKRYPPDPVDKAAAQHRKSTLWDKAITPERSPYDDLTSRAIEDLAKRTSDDALEAIKKLDAAVKLLPKAPEAYRIRGDAHLELKDWAACANDYALADAYTQQDDETPKAMAELERKLGLCQARAGKLAEAEKTLAETAASGNASGEIWMRLGEVRVAMGKLDEAIAALRSALDATDQAQQSLIHFMLAAAYDRARRPAEATAEVAEGAKTDRQLTTIENPTLPALGIGEKEYMFGIAWAAAEPPRPEYALAYFRAFVKAAPNSPWRRRADEHIKELRSAAFPEVLTRSGTAPLDTDAARSIVRKVMPAMRACLAKFPAAVVSVEITRGGPRAAPTDRFRPRFMMPPDGIAVLKALDNLSPEQLDAIDRCLTPLASRIVLPAVKDRDSYYRTSFYVVAP